MVKKPRFIAHWFLISLLLFNGISAIFGSLAMMIYPDGDLLKMPLEMLRGTPFKNYFIPGVLLFVFNGLLPIMAAAGLLKRRPEKALPGFGILSNYHWAWSLSLISGIGLIVWILVQIAMIGFWRENLIQAICLTEGLMIVVLTLLPSVQTNYALPKTLRKKKISKNGVNRELLKRG